MSQRSEVTVRLQFQAFRVFADYHQFYLWDREMDPIAPEEYTDDDVQPRIKTGPHVVVIQPERNMSVDVEIEVHDADPDYEPGQWDHIAEASLHLPSGNLDVEECIGGTVGSSESSRAGSSPLVPRRPRHDRRVRPGRERSLPGGTLARAGWRVSGPEAVEARPAG